MNAESIYDFLPISLQNLACTWAGRQRGRARFSPYFDDVLEQWSETGMSSDEALYEIQQDRLIELVSRARQFVPHYQRLGLPEPEPRTDAALGIEEILSAFPVLEKENYREAPESFIASDIPRDRLISGKTSGTTGSALPLWYTAEALAEEYASFWRTRCWKGVSLDDPHLSFGGQLLVPFRQTRPPFWRKNAWAGQTLFSLYHMTKENMPSYVEAVHSLPARYVQGYPSSLHLVARAMLDAGRPLPKGQIKAVFPSSESLLAYQRDAIEEAFAAPIFDRYGTSEFVVSMTSCDEQRFHLDMEFGIAEIDIQEETEDYVRGPLLVTGLANDATPFIRYRVGDVGTRSKHACPCGRPGDVFLEVDGRVEDYVVTPDGRWVGRLDHIFKDQLEIAEAQIIQRDAASIEVRIVPRESFDDRAEHSLMKEIRSRLGDEIRVDLHRVDEIPREANGKFRAVKSMVGRSLE